MPDSSQGLDAAPTATVRCACKPMHPGVPYRNRPEAHVRWYANPCEADTCIGRLICVGHAACVDCIAHIRADECQWGDSNADISLYAITSGGV